MLTYGNVGRPLGGLQGVDRVVRKSWTATLPRRAEHMRHGGGVRLRLQAGV